VDPLSATSGILLDTSDWIHHFEQNPAFGEVAGYVIEQLEAGRFRGIASELTLLESIAKPLQLGCQEFEVLTSTY
jgi:hypothetical protein